MILPNKNILITGGRAPATLQLARLLHQQKHNIYIADTFAYNLSGVSQFINKSFVIPPPRQAPKAFVKEMKRILKDYQIDILLPTCEETFHVSKYKDTFSTNCFVFCAPICTLHQLHDKWQFNQLLKKLTLPYPISFLAQSYAEAIEQIATLDKFVAKPNYSRFADNVLINDKKALKDIDIHPNKSWVIQQFIAGNHFCSFSVAHQGKFVAHSVYPVSYRVGNGAAVYFESTSVPAIRAIIQKIALATNYTGFLSFDFIQSDQDGLFYTLECNPRLTSGIHLFDAKDSFMPFDSNQNKICYPNPKNKMMLTLAMLVYSLPEVRSFRELLLLLKKMLQAEDAVFKWKDIKPFFAQLYTIFHFYRIAKQNNISILEATTHHIEWNGEH
jgi:predicted ATP-grasp superfamily ATP-dependent carboligase